MSRCRWINDPQIGPYHVPGCWGTVHDPDGTCICEAAEVSLEDQVAQLAASVERLLTLAKDTPNA